MKAIHQYSPSCAKGDGVSNSLFFIQKLLQQLGFISDIFCHHIPDELKGSVRPVEAYPADNEQVLLYHYSMGHDHRDWIEGIKDFKVIVYHNITPAHFFEEGTIEYKYSIYGREMLAEWGKESLFQGAIGDSEHNSEELTFNAFSHVKTIPLLVDSNHVLNQSYDENLVEKHQYSFTILFVGRISENKCQHDLIEIFNELAKMTHRTIELVIVGGTTSPAYNEHLEQLIKQYKLDDYVTITGKVNNTTLYSYYHSADLFMCMSEHEGFGMPLIEAMQLDIPVFAYDSPDSNVAATMGVGGLLFELKQPQSIAACISLLIKNPAFRRAIIKSQRENIKRFQSEQILLDLISYLQDLGLKSPLFDLGIKNIQSADNTQQVKWQIEGPFDSSYSLALLNREFGLSLIQDNQDVSFLSTEGFGDFDPNGQFLKQNPLIKEAWERSKNIRYPDVVCRYLYPPRTNELHGRINILHNFGWEESGVPPSYIKQFNHNLDGVSVMSHYVKKILQDHGLKIPISVVGVGVDHILRESPTKKVKLTKNFNFLHISSGFPRKGVDILLESYARLFNSRDDVCLVIKTFPNPHNKIETQLAELKETYTECPEVLLINEDLTDGEIIDLYQNCDVLVAPSRGEGFGLPMAEAMLLDMPVITTGFGGQMDFCNDDNSWLIDYHFDSANTHMQRFNSYWVEPDANHLSTLMKELFDLLTVKEDKQPDIVKLKTNLAKQTIQEQFLWEHVRQRTYNFVEHIEQQPIIAKLQNKMGWVSSWNCKCGIAEYSKSLLGQFKAQNYVVLANKNAELTEADTKNVIRCWDDGAGDDLNLLYDTILKLQLNTVVLQFNYAFFGIEEYASLLTRLKQKGVRCYSFFHSTSDVYWAEKKKSLGDMRDALADSEAIMVHGIADLNHLKTLDLYDNVVLFPHGISALDDAQKKIQNKTLNQLLHDQKFPNLAQFIRPGHKSPTKLNHKTVIASYGFLLPHKGIKNLISAFENLRAENKNLVLLLLNAVYPAPASVDEQDECLSLISASKYADDIIMINDFIDQELIDGLLAQVEMIVFPYQTTQESSSAAIRAGIRSGKPVVCSPLSIFSDVSDIVHFLPGTDSSAICDGLVNLIKEISRKPTQQMLQQNLWIQEHNWSAVSERLKNIIYRQD